MGFFTSFLSIFRSTPQAAERRYTEKDLLQALETGWGKSKAGVVVTRKKALSIPALWTGVDIYSKVLASIPFGLFQRTRNGSKEMSGDALHYKVKYEPSPQMTGFNWRRAFFAQAIFGDAYAKIHWHRRTGALERLQLLDAESMAVFVRAADGLVVYEYRHADNRREIMFADEVLHIKGLTMDGVKGEDLVETHRETLGLSAAMIDYSGSVFGNGGLISGILASPQMLSPEERQRIRSEWDRKYSGNENMGRTAVLDNGLAYSRVGMTPKEANLEPGRSFQVRELARILGLPLFLFQDLGDTTYNNVQQMAISFVTLSLAPWCRQCEQEFRLKLLPESDRIADKKFFYFNLDGLMRGDSAAMGALITVLYNTGSINPDEIREMFNMNKRPGGSAYFSPTDKVGNQSLSEELGGSAATDATANARAAN